MKTITLKAKQALIVSLLSVCGFSVNAFAETQKAHEHGAARLTMATSDTGLEIALESPAANIFGFEYKPSSDSDFAIVEKAKGTLKNGAMLFQVNAAAGCKLSDVDLESALFEDHDDHKDEHDSHDAHKDEHHDDHKDEHHGHDEHKEAHSDVDATWHFTCENANAISSVDVTLFSAFPNGFAALDVDWISATASGHVELAADGSVLIK